MAARGVVGLDIGTSAVRAAAVSPATAKSPLTLHRFGQVALPVGAVVGGEVVDVEAVAGAIRQLWAGARLGTSRVVLGVANQKVVVRQADLPWMTEKELRKSLAYQVADVIPMPVEQALLDVHLVEEVTAESGARMQRVMLVAAVRDMVTQSIAAVRAAGLTPVMVDLTPFAVLRALANPYGLGLSGEAEALVDVGASVTSIVVHHAGVPRFVRILPLGGAEVTAAVGERMGVPFEEAEAVKHTLALSGVVPAPAPAPAPEGALAFAGALPGPPGPPGLPAPDAPAPGSAHPASRAFELAVTTWVEEVRGSLDYYLAQPGSVRMNRLVLSGGGSRLIGLHQRLAGATGLEVVSAHPMSTLRVGRTGLSAEQLGYVEPQVVVPLGLALGRVS